MEKKIKNGFLGKFNFNPERTLFIGIEREAFTTNNKGKILPLTPKILPLIKSQNPKFQDFGYELSACQLEMRYGPYHISELTNGILLANKELNEMEKLFNFSCYFNDIAGQNIPLDVYPDPTGRYAMISASLKQEVLHAACYVAGTHIHIGMPSVEKALKVYNKVCKYTPDLIKIGDNSKGKRMSYYKLVANDIDPKPYESVEKWIQCAQDKGFYEDPRKCWTLIRISIHGTIEFRMFGSVYDLKTINEWAKTCYDLCSVFL